MMLIEMHIIQNHAPSNLNRDDSGSPKDCIFGGIRRTRISSQCLKHSIRKSELFKADLAGYLGTRTRKVPELIMKELMDDPGPLSLDLIEKIGRAMVNIAKKTGAGEREEEDEMAQEMISDEQDLSEGIFLTPQGIFLTVNEIKSLAKLLKEAFTEDPDSFQLVISYLDPESKINKKDAEKGRRNSKWLFNKLASAINWKTVDVALFGRMVTSEAFINVNASLQVAHALSTHKMEHEFDYFTAVDDLLEEQDIPGASMIGDVEFNSACYYKYFSLDFDALVDNLAGPQPDPSAGKAAQDAYVEGLEEAKKVAARTVTAFLKAAVFTTPTGKQNSFAAHQLPDGILVEVRPLPTPVSYANAFVKPAQAHGQMDLVEDSLRKLAEHVELLTRKFSLQADPRLWFCTREVAIAGTTPCETFDELLRALSKVVAG